MVVRADKIVVVDIEATCWEPNLPPPGQQGEIIEIGVCLLDVGSGALSGKRSILVRPERSTVSAFCTQLTTLTQEQVDGGVSFAEACAILERGYRSRERVWASWGNYDRAMFEAQCAERHIRYPFSEQHINVKKLFADLRGLRRRVGMKTALKIARLSLEGTHHRGSDDAWNIARLLAGLLADYQYEALLNARF